MAATSMPILSGQQLVDDGTGSPTAGAIPVYQSDGSIKQSAPSKAASGLGGVVEEMILTNGRTDPGATMTASAGSGTFGISRTAGTSLCLSGEAANNNTKTDKVIWEIKIPQFYKAGDNINVTVNAKYTLNSGTIGTKTLAAACYLCTDAGVEGSTLIATSAATLTASNADYAFVITGTTLTPGARIVLELTMAIQETASGGGIVGTVNSVRLS